MKKRAFLVGFLMKCSFKATFSRKITGVKSGINR